MHTEDTFRLLCRPPFDAMKAIIMAASAGSSNSDYYPIRNRLLAENHWKEEWIAIISEQLEQAKQYYANRNR